jgi:two-component system LytT family sensor kinase
VGELLNLIGLSTGVALYAMLLAMVVRTWRTPDAAGLDPLLLVTAILGLVWNLCALPAYELPKLGVPGPFPWLTVCGFSALGFLPAVMVQSVLRGGSGAANAWPRRSVAVVAYGVSGVAAVLHALASVSGAPLPSPLGMRLLTYTFIGLVIPLALVTRGQPGARRALWAAALSIFAVSALHLSQFNEGEASWPVELVGHHASVPLAFAILYQDFPFALADLFLKRAITLLALVTAPFVAVATLHVRPVVGGGAMHDVRDVAILVTLWVATALLYPTLRRTAAWFVDTIVLDRPDYDALRAIIARHAQFHEDIPSMLDDACARLAPALSARAVRWQEVSASGVPRRADRPPGVATVEIPVAEPPRYALDVGELTGGRRLLSDDRAALDAIASLLGRRIDAIRLARERYERQLREQEIGRLATEAELRALRSQINPHFLFNALTTIGYLIQTAPSRALDTLMKLTALLRGVLRSEGEFTTLGRELDLVESYLDIERSRFEHRLRVRIDVPSNLKTLRVPPLLLQPIVENAVKHGIAPQRHGGAVTVTARLETAGPAMLSIVVHDGASEEGLRFGRETGVGLKNVERRLACQYGPSASVTIRSALDLGTTVEIRMPAEYRMTEAAPSQSAS